LIKPIRNTEFEPLQFVTFFLQNDKKPENEDIEDNVIIEDNLEPIKEVSKIISSLKVVEIKETVYKALGTYFSFHKFNS